VEDLMVTEQVLVPMEMDYLLSMEVLLEYLVVAQAAPVVLAAVAAAAAKELAAVAVTPEAAAVILLVLMVVVVVVRTVLQPQLQLLQHKLVMVR
jgi:hypothetical protein